MRGVVEMVNSENGMLAVRTDEGFTVVEVLDSIDVEVEDEIVGKLDEHGGVRLKHVPSGERFDAFVQAIQASEQNARDLIR